MARITIADCQEVIPDRFMIIKIAARRAREIQDGSPTPIDKSDHKSPVIALREIADGFLSEEGVIFPDQDQEEYQDQEDYRDQ